VHIIGFLLPLQFTSYVVCSKGDVKKLDTPLWFPKITQESVSGRVYI
jgi:hypothetical protein